MVAYYSSKYSRILCVMCLLSGVVVEAIISSTLNCRFWKVCGIRSITGSRLPIVQFRVSQEVSSSLVWLEVVPLHHSCMSHQWQKHPIYAWNPHWFSDGWVSPKLYTVGTCLMGKGSEYGSRGGVGLQSSFKTILISKVGSTTPNKGNNDNFCMVATSPWVNKHKVKLVAKNMHPRRVKMDFCKTSHMNATL